tara:strand:+ start:285 stop:446 length:162 start_codon:yes stop_codon:yes gene_type:complete
MEIYKLSQEINKSNIEIFNAMDELQINYRLPNPQISSDNAMQIKKYFKKAKSK